MCLVFIPRREKEIKLYVFFFGRRDGLEIIFLMINNFLSIGTKKGRKCTISWIWILWQELILVAHVSYISSISLQIPFYPCLPRVLFIFPRFFPVRSLARLHIVLWDFTRIFDLPPLFTSNLVSSIFLLQ